ncbi:HEAT repeat domain-containing protein [Streptomyces sp. NPDC002308]
MGEGAGDGTAAAVRPARGAPLPSALDVTDAAAWIALDAGVREMAGYRSPVAHAELRGTAGYRSLVAHARLRETAGHRPPVAHTGPPPVAPGQDEESWLALALCHRDGRVRQEAIRRSAGPPGLLPLIVIRCADWVAPVREAARLLLRGALDENSATTLASLILLVGRRHRGAFAVELLGEVLRGASLERLAALFDAPDRAVRRFACRLAVERRLLGPVELARAAARDEDAVVQDLCATAALAALTALHDEPSHETYEAVLAPLLTARHPRVRSAGVTALRPAGLSERAEAFLGDRSALVRACARYVVRQHGGDAAAWYRERCTAAANPGSAAADPGLAPGAVVGLAECGNRPDAALLWPLLKHPAPRVRAGAVAGLRLLDCAEAGRLLPLLDDASAGVARETAVALLPSAGRLPADWLLERLSGRPRHVRLAAFRLLDARGGVEALRAAVGLLEDPDVKVRTRAEQSVRRWRPPADARHHGAEVGELLGLSRHLFSEHELLLLKREAGAAG